jgi:hypothetical protein
MKAKLHQIQLKNEENPFEIASKTYIYLHELNPDLAKNWLDRYRGCRTSKDVLKLSGEYVSFIIDSGYRKFYDENYC